MRVHSVTHYSRRFEGKIRKNDRYNGLTIAEKFNQFLPIKSHAYFEREEIYRTKTFSIF